MVDLKAKMQSWIFPCGTTYLNDFQLPPLSGTHRTVFKEKRKYTEKKPVQPMKDTQTLSEIRAAAVPFDLMIKRKDIIGTHPRMRVKKTNVSDVDTGLEEAIKTRPRLIMPPALAVDDFADKHAREILITDFYTSNTARMFQQAVKPSLSVMAPLVEDPAPALPLVLPSLQLPKVPMEWKMETITWDGKQLRGVTDPDKEFWKDHQAKMKECSACNVSRLVKNQRDLQRMMNSARR